MNCRPAVICVGFDDDTLPNVAAASTVDLDDGDDDSADDDVVGAPTQQVCSSASPVDLLRALPVSCATAMSPDDVASPPPTSTRRTVMLSPRLAACCRTCDVQRRRHTRVATVPVTSDAACTCPGWMSAKAAEHSPSAPLPVPPPAPQRSHTLPTDRQRRIDDAYTSGNVDFTDVELAAMPPTRHFDCFRFCCFRSSHVSEAEQKTTSSRMTGTADVLGLTTVCHCSAVGDTGTGNRNRHYRELNSNHTRGRRRRHLTNIMIACIVALPVTCLLLLGLCLMVSPVYQSSTGRYTTTTTTTTTSSSTRLLVYRVSKSVQRPDLWVGRKILRTKNKEIQKLSGLSGNFGYMGRSNPWGDLDQMRLVGRYRGRNHVCNIWLVTVG